MTIRMNIKAVQQLADLMEEKNLASLEFCEGDTKIHLVRGGVAPVSSLAQPAIAAVPVTAPAMALAEPSQTDVAAPNAEVGEPLNSPLVGVGYLANAPGEAPLAPVGSKVKKGQVLCIIEAMKVMNEFTAPRGGEIAEVCFKDGQLVEYGQPLFRLV